MSLTYPLTKGADRLMLGGDAQDEGLYLLEHQSREAWCTICLMNVADLLGMIKNYCSKILSLICTMQMIDPRKRIERGESNNIEGVMYVSIVGYRDKIFPELEPLLEELKLRQSLEVLNLSKLSLEMAQPIQQGPIDPYNFDLAMDQMATLVQAIKIELTDRLFYFVMPELQSQYAGNRFSQEVKDKFPAAIYDMEEAGKCLALNRSTACVYHLMRVFEHGFNALKDRFAIAAPANPSWEQYKKKVMDRIEQLRADVKNAKGTQQSQADLDSLNDLYVKIDFVRKKWRNPTIHADRSYQVEEAQEVLEAMVAMMETLTEKV